MFYPSLRLTPAHSSWLFFYFPPLQHLLPAHAVPLNFLGTLSCPFQIGFRLNSPCFMSLCWQIHSWYRHIIKTAAWAKYDLSKLFFLSPPPRVICHFRDLFLLPSALIRHERLPPWRWGRWGVSIKERCCLRIGVEASRWFHSGKWQHLLIWPFNFKSNSVRLHHLQSPPVIQNKPQANSHKHTRIHTFPN